MSTDKLDHKKAGDVARVSLQLREVLPCGICALGIAMDIVERYWNAAAPQTDDWKNGGHQCRVTEALSPEQARGIDKVEAAFFGRESAT